jgi:hypothetical protein
MKTQNEILTPEESMQIITKSLSNFKKNFREKSDYVLLWGYVIAIGSLAHFSILKYLLVKEMYDKIELASYVVWAVFALTGFIIQFFMIARSRAERKAVSNLDRNYTILWYIAAITIFLIAFLSLKFGIYPAPFILAVVGMATLISGLLIRFRPLIIGGMIFFLFSIITAYVTNEYQLLLNALAIITGYIIPGYILRSAKE